MTTASTDVPLFLYGSMLDADVLKIDLGRQGPADAMQGAELRGYRRLRVPDESYPVLVGHPEGSVWGALLKGLREQDWARIHFFESNEYALKSCDVYVGGARQRANFFAEGEMVTGATEPWTLEWWQTHHKDKYLHMIDQYMQIFGQADLEEAEALWARLHPST